MGTSELLQLNCQKIYVKRVTCRLARDDAREHYPSTLQSTN